MNIRIDAVLFSLQQIGEPGFVTEIIRQILEPFEIGPGLLQLDEQSRSQLVFMGVSLPHMQLLYLQHGTGTSAQQQLHARADTAPSALLDRLPHIEFVEAPVGRSGQRLDPDRSLRIFVENDRKRHVPIALVHEGQHRTGYSGSYALRSHRRLAACRGPAVGVALRRRRFELLDRDSAASGKPLSSISQPSVRIASNALRISSTVPIYR